jgi:hypothetical protein
MALVLWIRTLPLALLITDDRADQLMRQQLRNRLTQEAVQQAPGPHSTTPVESRVQQWIIRNQAQFAAEKAALSQRLKSQWRFIGEDGREAVYLGDFDSYLWLRHARNYLRTGTTCDAIVAGECRDTYGNAPVGARMLYNRSLHIAAIVGLHTLITRLNPAYPLSASAFWVPVVVGVLGVLPAFCLGRRLGGYCGGLAAAVLISLHPTVLLRSIGSDNDVWNVVLPLYMLWAAMAALGATARPRRVAYGVLAAACVGLHAAIWRGWPFPYLVLLSGLLGNVLLQSVRYALWQRTLQVWQAAEVRGAALVGVVCAVAAGLFTTLAGAEASAVTLPFNVLRSAVGAVFGAPPGGGGEAHLWPDVLRTVLELRQPDLSAIRASMGGRRLFGGALLGLQLLLLPRGRWHWHHYVLLLCGSAVCGYLLIGNDPGRTATVGLLALPLAGTLLLRLLDDEAVGASDWGTALVVLVWFLAALYLAYGGMRFLLLTAPAFGLAGATTVGRLYQWLGGLVQRMPTPYSGVARLLPGVLCALLFGQAVQQGYVTARAYTPRINDAWWDTLTRLRDASRPEAIVNTWWDYGHWVKYVAERRVSADGSSLLTHVPHWLGKALITPSERESVGVLRMLNCGSDAMPLPEGQRGAYGKLLAQGSHAVTAYEIVVALVQLEVAAARTYLAQRGFTPPVQEDILRSTHCEPPEAYLILSSEQLYPPDAWVSLGLWDLRRAYIARHTRLQPQPEAVADLVARFGYPEPEAARLYTQVRARHSARQLDAFIAPQHGYLSPQWLPCRTTRQEAGLVCPVGLKMSQEGSTLTAFVYHPASPTESRLRFRQPEGRRLPSYGTEGTPAVIVLAGAQWMEEIPFLSATDPGIAVLVDLPNQRILVGTPPLIRSTFTHLMYLDGRYATHYEKFDDRTAHTGERLVTWRVRWDGLKGSQQGSGGPLPRP